MSPVEHTSTSSAAQPTPSAVRAHMVSASALLGSPVAALALSLDSTIAAVRPPVAVRWRRLTTTGAATTRFWVNTPAAGTGTPSAVATRARSASPESLMPQATPAATKPGTSVMLIGAPLRVRAMSIRPCGPRHALCLWFARFARSRVQTSPGEAGVLGEAQHEVGALDRLAGGALDQVVEGGDGHHPAGAGVGPGGDVDRVGPERRLGLRRPVGHHHERLAVPRHPQAGQQGLGGHVRVGGPGVAGGEDAP